MLNTFFYIRYIFPRFESHFRGMEAKGLLIVCHFSFIGNTLFGKYYQIKNVFPSYREISHLARESMKSQSNTIPKP